MMCIEYNTYQTTGDDVSMLPIPQCLPVKNKETINTTYPQVALVTKVKPRPISTRRCGLAAF